MYSFEILFLKVMLLGVYLIQVANCAVLWLCAMRCGLKIMAEFVIRGLGPDLTISEIFQSLKDHRDIFFLDSAVPGNQFSKYSFIGVEPFLKIKLTGSTTVIEMGNKTIRKCGDPFEHLRDLLNEFAIKDINDDSRIKDIPFLGGAVGYISYDMCHFIENVPYTTIDDAGFPEMCFGFFDTFVMFENGSDSCYIISLKFKSSDSAEDKIDRLIKKIYEGHARDKGDGGKQLTKLQDSVNLELSEQFFQSINDSQVTINRGNVTSTFTKEGYIDAVKRAKEYINAGDIYQVNLSQRFKAETEILPHELYERLRVINPSPFSSFIGFDGFYTISSSPERLLCTRAVDNNNRFNDKRSVTAQIRPIKGTRPRCADFRADMKIRNELLCSVKDNAELTMIVDLERNDLGRVCDYGSVKVMGKKVLESYATVHHLVSTIEGNLNRKYDIVDLIKAIFPGGSITGAPKIRAMEIIDELESTRRSVYTGAIGYIGFDGNIDLSMAIRLFMLKDGMAYFQAGGGIVADSDPVSEYEETIHKAYALIKAIGMG